MRSQATPGLTPEQREARHRALREYARREAAIAALGEEWVLHRQPGKHTPPDPELLAIARERKARFHGSDTCPGCNGNESYHDGERTVRCPICKAAA